MAQHSTPSDCWVVVFDKVHNLTPFIPRHPGGPSRITAACGKDATLTFIRAGYVHDKKSRQDLRQYEIGDFSGASIPYSREEVAQHSSKHDCWVIIQSAVYDVTRFISRHPGGEDPIVKNCGGDATLTFEQGYDHPSGAITKLAAFKLHRPAQDLNTEL